MAATLVSVGTCVPRAGQLPSAPRPDLLTARSTKTLGANGSDGACMPHLLGRADDGQRRSSSAVVLTATHHALPQSSFNMWILLQQRAALRHRRACWGASKHTSQRRRPLHPRRVDPAVTVLCLSRLWLGLGGLELELVLVLRLKRILSQRERER